MLIHSAAQLLTLAGGPQRGSALGNLGLIPDGAVLVHGDRIAAVGSTRDLRSALPDEPAIDASGLVVMPGLVDPCASLVWADGGAANAFDPGHFVQSTQAVTRATAQARGRDLLDLGRARAHSLFRHGSTTAQSLTAYALQPEKVLDILNILFLLDAEGPLEVLPACLGNGVIPGAGSQAAEDFTRQVCDALLPGAADWWEARSPGRGLPAVAVAFGEAAFNPEQAACILARARRMGFPLHLLAGGSPGGAAEMAATFGCLSLAIQADLPQQDQRALAASETALVALPAPACGMGMGGLPDLHPFLAAGGLLALGTGFNPVSAWGESMQFVLWLACRFLNLSPEQAIAAATINAAASLGRAGLVGSLDVGKQADLVLLDIPDYRQVGARYGTNLVRQVIKKGKVYTWATF